MIVGVLGHAARFAVFAFFADSIPVIVAVQLLHGICYAFFFATVYIFVDAVFPKDVRSSAQGLFNLLILGVGNVVASFLFPTLVSRLSHAGADGVASVDYTSLFLVPTGMEAAGPSGNISGNSDDINSQRTFGEAVRMDPQSGTRTRDRKSVV